MLQWIKKTLLILAFGLLATEKGWSFSLLGPYEPYQVATIGYNLPGDIGGPHNLGEEYRWTTPYIYYAFDANFLDYFGSNGVFAIERGIGLFNALTNFSSYSADLSEFPLESQRINPRAQALSLYDLKSVTMNLLLEELGLTDPIRYTWTLRGRDTQPGLSCPFMIYTVIKRNFDPVTWEPSSYVNGNLYSYLIVEICTGRNPLADAVEFLVDPDAQDYSPVTSEFGVLRYGSYVTSFSRDDIGGLRYLYETNNMNNEATTSDSLLYVTNRQPSLIVSSNINLLFAQSLTNDPVALSNLYPGLIITSTSNFFGVVASTNLGVIFTNEPWLPANLFNVLFTTNITYNVQTYFAYTFGNIATVQLINGHYTIVPITDLSTTTNRNFYSVITTSVTNSPYSTGVLITNSTRRTFLTSSPGGEFFILPTNVCDIQIITPLLTNIVTSTNFLVSSTNNPALTNLPPGFTNFSQQSFEQVLVQYFTNHYFLAYLTTCVGGTNTVALREGIDHFTFLRTSFDSLLGRFFQPVTNTYYLIEVTNSVPRTNWFQRVVTHPDILFSAQDLVGNTVVTVASRTDTASTFNTNNEYFGLFGPGNIDPSRGTNGISIVFDKVGPSLQNFYFPNQLFNGLSESLGTTNFIWASYDGTTNAPIIYPQGTSIRDLENQVFYQIVSPVLSAGRLNVPYSESVIVTGGTAPYSFAPAAGSPPLPPGLILASNGIVSGNPTTEGSYTFVVTATDAASRITTRTVSITINR